VELTGALDHIYALGVDAAELLLVHGTVLVLERVGVAAAAARVGGAADGKQQQQHLCHRSGGVGGAGSRRCDHFRFSGSPRHCCAVCVCCRRR